MRSVFAVLLACTALPAQQAWHTTAFPVSSQTGWHINGGPPPNTYLTSAAPGGISMLRTGGPTGDQEVRGTLRLRASGGSMVLYLRATQNALLGVQGTFYAFEVQAVSVGSGACLMHLSTWKAINGVHTLLDNRQNMPCVDGMEWRFFIRGGQLGARYEPWRGNVEPISPDNSIASGLAGVGVRNSHADNGITQAGFYHIETQAPLAPANLSGAAFGNRVELQWHGFEDPAPSSGLYLYTVQRWRNGLLEASFHPYTPSYADTTVQPSTAYQYRIYATDIHKNLSAPAVVAVTTPAAGTREPRRIGLRPDAAAGDCKESRGDADQPVAELQFSALEA